MMRFTVGAPALLGREREYVVEAMDRVELSNGPMVERFEKKLAAFVNTRYAVACSSGTAALHLALVAQGVGPGWEVVVPALTYIATANAVSYTGARVVLVDSDRSWCLDPEQARYAVNEKTGAILPVHLYGEVADMTALSKLRVPLVEDAAEAFGARRNAASAGSLGDMGCFSFYGNKTITTAEGGAVTTNDAYLAGKVRLLRDSGMSSKRKYWHEVIGFNYAMSNLHAALGVGQIEMAEKHLNERRRVACAYRRYLPQGYAMQPSYTGSFWAVAVEAHPSIHIPGVAQRLKDRGVETRPVFPPVHLQPCYEHLGYREGQFPVAEWLHRHGLVLPTHALLSDADVEEICDELRRAT